MRAVVIHETGGPEVPQLEEVDRPEPGEGEVLIEVRAVSVNPVDWKHRRASSPSELPAVYETGLKRLGIPITVPKSCPASTD
jgi:NADPH:quinone reductase-like Zn-dependent oxidoreductase